MSVHKEKSELTRLLFTDHCEIKRDSKEYDGFWPFLKKYECREAASNCKPESIIAKAKEKLSAESSSESSLPSHLADEETFVKDARTQSSLKKDQLRTAYRAFVLYRVFLEKKKADALRKLREFQRNLPIAEHQDTIVNLLRDNRVLLIAGDTGCGKSTQVPQYLLQAGYTNIVCTQPRRIATVSLSQRVSYEMQTDHGTTVGYQIRFERRRNKETKMLFMTHGLLIRQALSDPTLSEYGVIILDEIHERNLACDFLLGLIKCILHQRPDDLKVILMSATINIELFSSYFDYCPVVQVPGRLFPIVVHYRPVTEESRRSKSGRLNPEPYLRVLELIDHKYPVKDEKGDVLIFLSGISEITALQEALEAHSDRWIALPLHSTLSIDEQEKVFAEPPPDKRKVVLSTNIAETSVTIDGVRFVVDSGKCKEMTFDAVCRLQRLKEFWTSRAGAEQRKGRAGRTGPGECFRLYSLDEYEALQSYTTPEIRRLPLHSLLLQLIHMGLPDVRKFPFLEPPSQEVIEESLQTLKEQGALQRNEALTPIGRFLAILPVDIMVGKVLLYGSLFPVLFESILTLAAALSTQSIFTMKSYRDLDICAARRFLESSSGDPFAILNAFEHLNVECYKMGNSARKICSRLGLDLHRYYEMHKLRALFRRLLEEHGICAKHDASALSSVERARRHGERYQLLKMRKEHERSERERKGTKRRLADWSLGEGNVDEEEGTMDIGEIELRLSQDASKMQRMMDPTSRLSNRDKAILRWIYASGVYPQIAIADVHNTYSSGSDQVFHTKSKGFVVLHPNSVFAMNPSYLQLEERDILRVEKGSAVSTRHQIVAFMSLLETNKAQLLNMTRVATLPTLLLCASSIDSNAQLTRLVFDSFLEISSESSEEMSKCVLMALHARRWFNVILDRMLQETVEQISGTEYGEIGGESASVATLSKADDDDAETKMERPEVSVETRRMQRYLMSLIDEVLQTYHAVPYVQKRLLAADLKYLYNPDRTLLDPDAQSAASLFDVDEIKGGFKVGDFFTYASLDGGPVPKSWKKSSNVDEEDDKQSASAEENPKPEVRCPGCDVIMEETTFAGRAAHVMRCRLHYKMQAHNSSSEHPKNAGGEKDAVASTTGIKYECSVCKETLRLTPYQVLQHKRLHQPSSSSDSK